MIFKIYFPGVISLLGIPLVLFCFHTLIEKNSKIAVLPVVFSTPMENSENPGSVAAHSVSFLPKREYAEILIGESESVNTERIEFAMQTVRKLRSEIDTSHGIRLCFTEHSRYGDFVRVIDSLHTAKWQSFMPYEYDVWIYYLPSIYKSESNALELFECGTSYYTRRDYLKADEFFAGDKKTQWDIFSIALLVGYLVVLFSYLLDTAGNIGLCATRDRF